MKNSHIQWTDNTFNCWIGCTKVSEGCARCYAEKQTYARVSRSKGVELWGKGKERHRTSEANWREPIKWNAEAEAADFVKQLNLGSLVPSGSNRPKVFCASLADWLDEEVPIEWLADLLKLIHDCPFLDWQLLTKRPQNFATRIEAAQDWHFDHGDRNVCGWIHDWRIAASAPKNVWLGTSMENQQRADERMPILLNTPAAVRFVSVEPMLSGIDLAQACGGAAISARLDWVICGGESGPGARKLDVKWVETLVEDCKSSATACFVKQLGANPHIHGHPMRLKHAKGGDPTEWPKELQIQQFPESE